MTDTADPPQDVEGSAVEVHSSVTSHALTVRRAEVIRPLPADEVRAAFAACQSAALAVLGPDDFEGTGDDRFLKKSGVRKVAAVTDLDVSIIGMPTVERGGDGRVVAAAAIARATTAAGRSMDGDGYCSIDEIRFHNEKGRQRLEHDLRSTATTRAKTRAIAELLGIDVASLTPGRAASGPAAPSDELRRLAEHALGYLLDGDIEAIQGTDERLAEQFASQVPASALQTVLIVAKGVKDHRERLAAAEPQAT